MAHPQPRRRAGSLNASKNFRHEISKLDEQPAAELPKPNGDLYTWQKGQLRAGMLPFSTLAEIEAGIPDGILPPIPPTPPPPILSPGQSLDPVNQYEKETKAYHKEGNKCDNILSEEDWKKVYSAYSQTGAMGKLVQLTGLSQEHLKHLLDYGIKRLGLPPIREHAVDLREVALRIDNIAKGGLPAPPRAQDTEMVHLNQVREATTARATREAILAHGILTTTLKTTDSLLGYVNQFLAQTQQRGYELPEAIKLDDLEALAKATANMTRAVDMAVRLSRFTAGEPERNIAIEVATIAARMTIEERRIFNATGVIPAHLRLKGAADIIDVPFTPTGGGEEPEEDGGFDSEAPLPEYDEEPIE